MPWNKATSFNQIFDDIDTINETITSTVVLFIELLEEKREQGLSDEEILEEINETLSDNLRFATIEDAEEWFNDLGL